MNKVALFLLLFVISSVGVYAQTDSSSDSADQTTTRRLENARELIKSRREVLKDAISEQKETFKERVKQAREALQTQIKADRAAFKESLLEIKDQKKQGAVERIDAKISSINTKHTDRLADGLDKLQAILDRISTSGSELKSSGSDTSSLDSLITSAQTSINAAKTAVAGQAAQDYTITLGDENRLKEVVSPVVLQFRTDIKAVHDLVVAAKNSVRLAGNELKTLKGGDSATNSAVTQ